MDRTTSDRERIEVQSSIISLSDWRNSSMSLMNGMPRWAHCCEWSDLEIARRACPCFNMVFAKNCAKGPKPIIPIFRALTGADDVDEAMILAGA